MSIHEKSHSFSRVVLVPGFGATIADHWFPWLANQIPDVERVALPHPEAPDARVWIPTVAKIIGTLDAGTAVVTHSLGGITALQAIRRLANQSTSRARLGAFIAVAPFARILPPTGADKLDTFNATGLTEFLLGLESDSIRSRLGCAHAIRSDNDPIVPARLSNEFASIIDANTTVVVPGAGHFLAEDGITALPAVVNALAEGR